VRRIRASRSGRFLLQFVPIVLTLGVLGAVNGEWGLVAVCAFVALALFGWATSLRGRELADRPPSRAWIATVMAAGVFAYATFALRDEAQLGALLPVAIFAAFALGFAIRGPERR
jgi:hypothetical protein